VIFCNLTTEMPAVIVHSGDKRLMASPDGSTVLQCRAMGLRLLVQNVQECVFMDNMSPIIRIQLASVSLAGFWARNN